MFTYKTLSPFLEEDYYNELEASWPSYEQIAQGRDGDNKLFQRGATEVLGSQDIPQIWQTFFQEMLATFTDRVEELFGVEFPKDRAVRWTEPADFYVDVQFAVNSPSSGGRVRGPHVDNPVEAYACNFYMRDPEDDSQGGDLKIYRWLDERKFTGKAEIEDERVEPIDTVPYGRNIACVFLNSLDAIHGVTVRKSKIPRRYINIIGEYNEPQFNLPRDIKA